MLQCPVKYVDLIISETLNGNQCLERELFEGKC